MSRDHSKGQGNKEASMKDLISEKDYVEDKVKNR